MSTVKANNHQVGQNATATNNFTLYQPASPDGTVRLGVGNTGATTLDAMTVTNAGNVTFAGSVTATSIAGVTVAVANGGTGSTSLTANNVLLGNGTSALQVVAPGTSGNVLTSNGTTWASTAPASTAPTTAQVLTATAGATAGAVGTYAYLGETTVTTTTAGSTRAGSGLRYAGSGSPQNTPFSSTSSGIAFVVTSSSSGTPSGTWRAMGDARSQSGTCCTATIYGSTLWLRIS